METLKIVFCFALYLPLNMEVCSQPKQDFRSGASHPCRRPCKEGVTMTCFYTFQVEWYYSMSKACYDCPNRLTDCYREDCVVADGFGRVIMVANRQLPGPSIEVCLGDKVIVDIENHMNDETTSIHWHGHHQERNPFMDGVPFITQCPISPNSVFRYTMYATNPGTHFWHSHTGTQRADGLFGPLVVRMSEPTGHSSLYDQDLSEHVIIINDWTHVPTIDKLQWYHQNSGNNNPDSLLVNGKGRYFNNSQQLTNTPFTVFTVQQGLRYRFRLINSGVYNCPVELYIDGHSITAIASDGYDFHPVKVDSLVSYAGERWDFVVEASQPVDNYWMRFTGLMDCDERFTRVHQVAVLHYKQARQGEPSLPVGYNIQPKSKLQLNPLNVGINQTGTLSVPSLHASDKSADDVVLKEIPDTQIILSFDFNKVDHPVYHKHNAYGFKQVNETLQRYTPQINHISFKMPQSPLLSQLKEIDADTFCYKQNLSNCESSFCECTHIIDITTHSAVELILIDRGVTYNANHPFHLHGYGFRVVGMDRLGESTEVDLVKRLDKEGKLVRNLQNPPSKDTVTVPDGGYTILRFLASNPGYWIMHCHLELHIEEGMAVVFKVGEDDELPPVPDGFPKCGDFKNTMK